MKKLSIFADKIQNNTANLLLSRPLAVFSTIVFISVVLRLYFPIEPLLLLSFFIGIILVWLKVNGKIDTLIMIFIAISLFLGHFAVTNRLYDMRRITYALDGQFVRAEGSVATVPEEGEYYTSFLFDCDTIKSHYGEFDENIKIHIRTKDYKDLRFGDRLIFNATLTASERANAYFGSHYLSKGAVFAANNILLLDKSDKPGSVVATMRNYIIDTGNKFFAGDTKEFFKALVAGDRSGFSSHLTSSLSKSGLSHVVSVSGLHITIIGMAVFNLLRRRNRIAACILSLAAVFLFSVIAGATPPILRSAIMFASFITAKMVLMDNDGFTSLSLSAMVLALINPFIVFDWGFILSFLSVLGIQIFMSFFKELLSFLPDVLSDSISVTLSAQIMTLPALVNMFGCISTYSVLSNIVVSAIFVWVLYLCFIVLLASFIPFVNQLVSIVCALGLDLVIAVSNLFADLPFSTLSADYFNIWELIAYYTLVLLFVFRKKLSTYFICIAMLICALIMMLNVFIPADRYETEYTDNNSYLVNYDL